MTRLAAVVALSLLTMPSLVSAQQARCTFPILDSGKPSDPVTYLTSVIDSLGWAKQGRSRLAQNGPDASNILYRLASARGDFDCAVQALEEFTNSDEKFIQESAQLLTLTYKNIGLILERFSAEVVDMLNQVDAGQTVGSGTVAKRLADLRQEADGAWGRLGPAVAMTLYAAVAFDDGHATGRLRITNAQRAALRRAIEKKFGPSVRGGMKAGQEHVLTSAAMLYEFLGDKKWRSADGPYTRPSSR